jgi:hypothetical protein
MSRQVFHPVQRGEPDDVTGAIGGSDRGRNSEESVLLTGKVESMDRSPQSSPRDNGSADDTIEGGSPAADAAGGAPAAPAPTADYVDGVPTFDFVRDRIEIRYATAVGSTELAEDGAEGRSLAQQEEDRKAAAQERLEQIRRSLSGE